MAVLRLQFSFLVTDCSKGCCSTKQGWEKWGGCRPSYRGWGNLCWSVGYRFSMLEYVIVLVENFPIFYYSFISFFSFFHFKLEFKRWSCNSSGTTPRSRIWSKGSPLYDTENDFDSRRDGLSFDNQMICDYLFLHLTLLLHLSFRRKLFWRDVGLLVIGV